LPFQRTGKEAAVDALGWFGFVAVLLVMALLNFGAAYIVELAVGAGQRLETEKQGKIVVGRKFLDALHARDGAVSNAAEEQTQTQLEALYAGEARRRSHTYGGAEEEHERRLRQAVASHPSGDFVDWEMAEPGIQAIAVSGALPALLGSLVLGWWFVMMICQGEGLELDTQRRHHPMWEWLFSHPVSASALFTAEMLSPLAANPTYCSAPVFFGCLYGLIYGSGLGIAAGVFIGVPITIATACVGKALEIAITLRFSTRSRGAMIGVLGWLGYTSMMLWLLLPTVLDSVGEYLRPLTAIPWPWLGWMIGAQSDGSFSLLAGMVVCWAVAFGMIAGGVGFSVWGVQRGLASGGDRAPRALAISSPGAPLRFGSDPL
jgi:hypothetical protein